jgi:hypothetical protein
MQTKEIEKERKVKKKYKQRSLSWVSRLLQPSTSLRRLPWLSSSVVVSDRHVEEVNVVIAVMVRCHRPRQSRRQWRRVSDPDLVVERPTKSGRLKGARSTYEICMLCRSRGH